ncbi:MAG: DUF2917 domain-containing protein [Burkholderiaceae bacterium]
MNTNDLNLASIQLGRGTVHRVRNGFGQRIEALSGCVWITIDNDARDIILEPGEGFRIDRHGEVLITALIDDARVALLQSLAPRRT